MIVQPFNLNLIPEQSPTVIHVDQYDHGTGRLLISLFDGDTPYTPSGTAVIQGTKPDGKGFQYVCTLSGNKVTANLTDQMTAVAGRVRTQVVVTETSGRTGTFAFVLDVQKSALPSNTDMSESDYQLIEEAIEEVQASAADAEGYAQDAEAWAQGTRDGEPVSPTDPTYNHNAEYWARYAEEYSQGGMHYKASILASAIPVAGMHVGDMYNIEDSFTTDSSFQEGAGIEVDAGTNIVYNTNEKWDLLAMPIIPTMTASVLGIGSPDGMTSDVNNGIFRAKGVAIYCTVNPSGTEHGANWLKYGDTVITPSNIQLYLVYIDGDPTLWAWNGASYVMVSASGAGGLVSILQADFDLLPTADKNDPEIWWWISDADGVVSTTGSGGGTSDYTDLSNKPSINGVTLIGNQTSSTLHIGGEGTSDYTALINKPRINGHTLSGNSANTALDIPGKVLPQGSTVYLDDQGTTGTVGQNAEIFNDYANRVSGSIAGNVASGDWSHAEGRASTASGNGSHCEGMYSTASNSHCHAEGKGTYATGDSSHSEGDHTHATSLAAHAEGYQTTASNWYAHAEGEYTVASAQASHAGGRYTIANQTAQTAIGQYNATNSNSLFVVGNGTSDNARSNAFEVFNRDFFRIVPYNVTVMSSVGQVNPGDTFLNLVTYTGVIPFQGVAVMSVYPSDNFFAVRGFSVQPNGNAPYSGFTIDAKIVITSTYNASSTYHVVFVLLFLG